MLKRIEIRNFKAIRDNIIIVEADYNIKKPLNKGEFCYISDKKNKNVIIPKPLILDDLAQVNYLVGRNGSGKSSILSALSNFKYDSPNNHYHARSFFESNGEIILVNKENLMNKIYFDNDEINKVKATYEFDIDSVIFDTNVQVASDKASSVYKVALDNMLQYLSLENEPNDDTREEFLRQLNETLLILGMPEINIGWASKDSISKPTFFIRQDGKEINPQILASGVLQLHNLRVILLNKYSQIRNINSNFIYILIEEPENNLHPQWQKELPKLFENILLYLKNTYPEKEIQFLISTHSPFIISAAAKEKDQKVYLIEEGQCKNPQGSEKGGAKLQALKMLGAGLEDFIPKNIIVCEGGIENNKTGFQHDANIYNELFGNLEDAGFYSGGGSSEIIRGGTKMKDLVNVLGGTESKFYVLVESDVFEKEKTNLIKKYNIDEKMVINTGSFNEIEDFLYHKDVLNYLKNNLKLDVETEIVSEKDKKDKHKNTWWKNNFMKLVSINVTDADNLSRKQFELSLAKIIREEFGKEDLRNNPNNIYWQLYNCIFGNQILK